MSTAVLPRWAATRDAGLLAVCPVVALELLAAARNEEKFANLERALQALALFHVKARRRRTRP